MVATENLPKYDFGRDFVLWEKEEMMSIKLFSTIGGRKGFPASNKIKNKVWPGENRSIKPLNSKI